MFPQRLILATVGSPNAGFPELERNLSFDSRLLQYSCRSAAILFGYGHCVEKLGAPPILFLFAIANPPNSEMLQFHGVPEIHFLFNPGPIGVDGRNP